MIRRWGNFISRIERLFRPKQDRAERSRLMGMYLMRALGKRVGNEFLLTAMDHPTVRAHLNRWNLRQGDGRFQAYGAQVAAEDKVKMVPGVAYQIRPINISDTYWWEVAPVMPTLTFNQ